MIFAESVKNLVGMLDQENIAPRHNVLQNVDNILGKQVQILWALFNKRIQNI